MLSIVYVATFAALLGGIVYCPKTEGRINGVKILVMGMMGVLCAQTVAARVLGLLHIRVGCLSISVILLIFAAAFWILIWKRGRQVLFWRRADVACVLCLLICVCAVCVRCYGFDLRLQDLNGDAARYFSDAMEIVRTGGIPEQHFSTLMAALIIEVLSPVLSELLYYKAFLLADMFLHMLEISMLYMLILTVSERKLVRILAPVFSVAYFWGYPVNNYVTGGFMPWSGGVMLLMLVLYAALLVEKKRFSWKYSAAVPILAVLVGFGCDQWFVWEPVSATGNEVYSSMYADLIFFVPVFLYVLYHVFGKKRSWKVPGILCICMLLYTIGLYTVWYRGGISLGGYYKSYYYLWMLGWILSAQAMDVAEESRELAEAFSYAGLIGVLTLLAVFDVGNGPSGPYVTQNLFALYRYNSEQIQRDYAEWRFTDEEMEAYDYVFAQKRTAAILTEDAGREKWFDAVTANDSSHSSFIGKEFPDALQTLVARGPEYAVVWKDDGVYEEHQEYFAGIMAVFENESVVVYGMPEGNWTDISGTKEGQDPARLELYAYVKEYLADEEVPLMAMQSSYLDYVLYENITGNDCTEFYPWNFEPLENLDNLNAHGVKYVVLLAHDAYYIGNQYYFDRQQVVFGNEAGKVVRCVGNTWSTAY